MKEVSLSKEFINSEFGILRIKEFTENDSDLVKSTLVLIKETLKEDLKRLSELITLHNFEQAKSVCHKMKPNFELIGLIGISGILNEIEQGKIEEEKSYSIIELIINLEKKITERIDKEILDLDTN